MSFTEDYCLLQGTVLRVTERAVLFEIDERGTSKQVWIPRSVIEDGHAAEVFDTELYIKEWFVEKEGL